VGDDAPPIGDLTEDTSQTPQEMDMDEDILIPISISNIPKEIKKFIPNIKWNRDLEKTFQSEGMESKSR
jgi:hypothetical protein